MWSFEFFEGTVVSGARKRTRPCPSLWKPNVNKYGGGDASRSFSHSFASERPVKVAPRRKRRILRLKSEEINPPNNDLGREEERRRGYMRKETRGGGG